MEELSDIYEIAKQNLKTKIEKYIHNFRLLTCSIKYSTDFTGPRSIFDCSKCRSLIRPFTLKHSEFNTLLKLCLTNICNNEFDVFQSPTFLKLLSEYQGHLLSIMKLYASLHFKFSYLPYNTCNTHTYQLTIPIEYSEDHRLPLGLSELPMPQGEVLIDGKPLNVLYLNDTDKNF